LHDLRSVPVEASYVNSPTRVHFLEIGIRILIEPPISKFNGNAGSHRALL
jgi:hypothetical protein